MELLYGGIVTKNVQSGCLYCKRSNQICCRVKTDTWWESLVFYLPPII